MGKSIVALAVEKLQAEGFRAAEACPGRKLPALTDIAVAVDLEKVDLREKTAQLLISVLAPSSMGAQACQKAALSVGQVLQEDGADCTQESCSFDGLTNLFCTNITARYAGTASAEDWSSRAGFSVSLAGVPLGSLVSFSVKREVDETVTVLADAKWTFELEEFFRPEDFEETEPEEPFTLVMKRPMQMEMFRECTFTYQQRITEQTGTRQIRRGVATRRSITVYD